MAISFTDADGKKKYIKGSGGIFHLSRNIEGALDQIPDGWKIIRRKNRRLSLIRDR